MKEKEVIRLRRKATQSGESLYLDIYFKGKRRYEFLRLYLIPERTKSRPTQKRTNTPTGNCNQIPENDRTVQQQIRICNGKTGCQSDRVYTTGCRKQTETGKNRNQGNFRHSGLPFDKISWG